MKTVIKEINQIDTDSKEGMYLMAALAILTTEGKRRKKTPFQVLDEIGGLKEKMYGHTNSFNCPKKLWNKFSEKGKAIYNVIRGLDYKTIYPKAGRMAKSDWETILHNIGVLAALEA